MESTAGRVAHCEHEVGGRHDPCAVGGRVEVPLAELSEGHQVDVGVLVIFSTLQAGAEPVQRDLGAEGGLDRVVRPGRWRGHSDRHQVLQQTLREVVPRLHQPLHRPEDRLVHGWRTESRPILLGLVETVGWSSLTCSHAAATVAAALDVVCPQQRLAEA